MEEADAAAQAARQWAQVFPDEDMTVYEVMLRLIRGGRLAETALSPGAEAAGLPVPGDYEVLAALRRSHPHPLQPSSISNRVMVSPPGITGRIDRLEEAALIERRPHPTDRRAVLIHLTELGRRVADDAFTSILTEMRRLTDSLKPGELKRVASCLETMLVALGDVATPAEAAP